MSDILRIEARAHERLPKKFTGLRPDQKAELLRRESRLAPARLVDWIEQLLVGVRDCHRENIVHRDGRPRNRSV